MVHVLRDRIVCFGWVAIGLALCEQKSKSNFTNVMICAVSQQAVKKEVIRVSWSNQSILWHNTICKLCSFWMYPLLCFALWLIYRYQSVRIQQELTRLLLFLKLDLLELRDVFVSDQFVIINWSLKSCFLSNLCTHVDV